MPPKPPKIGLETIEGGVGARRRPFRAFNPLVPENAAFRGGTPPSAPHDTPMTANTPLRSARTRQSLDPVKGEGEGPSYSLSLAN